MVSENYYSAVGSYSLYSLALWAISLVKDYIEESDCMMVNSEKFSNSPGSNTPHIVDEW